MTMEHPTFEDVFPIENEDIPFIGVYPSLPEVFGLTLPSSLVGSRLGPAETSRRWETRFGKRAVSWGITVKQTLPGTSSSQNLQGNS